MSFILRVLFSVTFLTCFTRTQDVDGFTDENRPYKFGFNIEGYQHRYEEKNEKGIIMGEYGFITGDGIYHLTVYATDENGNFKILRTKNVYIGLPGEKSSTPIPAVTSLRPERVQVVTKNTVAEIQGVAGCGGCVIPTTAAPQVELPGSVQPIRGNIQGGSPQSPIGGNSEIQGYPAMGNTQIGAGGGRPAGNPGIHGYPALGNTQIGAGGGRPAGNPGIQGYPAPGNTQIGAGGGRPAGNPGVQGYPAPENTRISTGGGLEGLQEVKTPSIEGSGQYGAPTPNSSPIPALNDISNDLNDPKIQKMLTKVPKMTDKVTSMDDLQALFYMFNYTLTYHGHNEYGNRGGDKNGSYFFNGRDGFGRNVSYIANEFGYQPNITLYDLTSEETPKEETEKNLTKLLGNEFKWFYSKG